MCLVSRSLQVNCDAVRQRLQSLVWREMPVFLIPSLHQLLASHLSLISEFKLKQTDDDNTDSPAKCEVKVMLLEANQELMEGLRRLPDVPGVLNMSFLHEWVLEPSAYSQLAQAVPTGFDTWVLPYSTPEAVMAAIVAGLAASNRTVNITNNYP